MSHVASVVTALPPHVYPQEDITRAIGPLVAPDGPARTLMERVHRSSGVRTRHLALPLEEYAGLGDFGRSNDLFLSIGTTLAEDAVRQALDATGLTAQDVDFLLFTSVTGLSAPSVDASLVQRLGMRSDVKRLPSFGLGCAGGAAGVARVHDYLAGHPDDVAVLVSLELCSLTIQRGDTSPAALVSCGLFGDGAAAAVMVGDAHPLARAAGDGPGATGPDVVAARSRLYPGTDGDLGWDIGGSGFRIVLSAQLPDLIESELAQDVEGLLEAHGLKPGDVTTWVAHAGGPKVLDAVERSLGLDPTALDVSRASLAAVGNLSSASVLHVLAATIDTGPAPGSPGMMLAFGPGVTAELVLLRWPEGD